MSNLEKKTIILIEDDPKWLDLFKRPLLEGLGDYINVEDYHIFEAGETRILQQKKPFDLLITDIFASQSRETRGITIANFVKINRNIPVIVITGEPSHARLARQNQNIDDVFDKGGYNALEFIQSVTDLLKIQRVKSPPEDKPKSPRTGTIF